MFAEYGVATQIVSAGICSLIGRTGARSRTVVSGLGIAPSAKMIDSSIVKGGSLARRGLRRRERVACDGDCLSIGSGSVRLDGWPSLPIDNYK